MSIVGNLKRWEGAGLIDTPTAERILEFERGRKRPLLAYALGGLGALTIIVGIISVVAANWDALGRFAKLGLDLAGLGALAYGLWRAQNRWARETLAIIYFGAILASIALVAQVYQLGGALFGALLFWLILGTPVVLLGRSALLAALWLAGLTTTVGYGLSELWERWSAPDLTRLAVDVAAGSLLIVGTILAGHSEWIRARRRGFAALFLVAGWVAFLLVTSVAQHVWYLGMEVDELPLMTTVVPLLLGGLLIAVTPWLLGPTEGAAINAVRAAIAVAIATSVAPLFIAHESANVVGALSFIALWLSFAVAFYRLGRVNLLNLATAVIGLRVIIAYIEVFGSLLQTGIAMIVGGAITIGIAWLWVRKARDFKREVHSREGAIQ